MAKDDGKGVAIISYITIIGWIIAIIMNSGKKTRLGSFHLRQTLMIYIVGFIVSWIKVIGGILGLILFVFWVMGLVYAIQGKEKEVPLIGPLAQKWFKGI